MRSTEIRAVGELAGSALAGTGSLVRDVHVALARRAFAAARPGAELARLIQDGVRAAVYGGARVALGALALAAPTARSGTRSRATAARSPWT
jgi:hypothetical protein